MARIQYDTLHPGKLLRRTLAGYLTHAIEELPVDPKSIYEMVVVGNSTMRDLFFRQSVYTIGQSPYRSITEIEMEAGKRTTTSLTETGRRCLLPIHPKARVYGAPIISGHVGADAAACMLAADLAHEDRVVAVMDIGTNTELIVGNRHRILAASCPAGPAFEGGAIACGMPALDGAIEDVRIDDEGRFHLRTVGGAVPQGICGSGLVALMSELLRTGRMNERGRFEDDGHRIDLADGVYFLESDVNELAQAKGANVAGLQVVFHQFGMAFDDVGLFYSRRRLRQAHECRRRDSYWADSVDSHRPDGADRQRGNRRRDSGAALADEARGTGAIGAARGALPTGDASAIFRFLRGRLPVPSDLRLTANRRLRR